MGEYILPAPDLDGRYPLERCIFERRSCRRFKSDPLTRRQVSQLLWATQGQINSRRAVPSAGATYPLEVFLITGEAGVDGIHPGVYQYIPGDHKIRLIKGGDIRDHLSRASLGQGFIRDAPVSVLIAADYIRTTSYYGDRGIRYVDMEAGHAGQNLYLQVTSLGLETVAVGAFHDEKVREVTGISKRLIPLYIMPIGYVRQEG